LALMLLAVPAAALAPEDSLRPLPRPVVEPPAQALPVSAAQRPQLRPASSQETALRMAFVALPDQGPGQSLRPALRPDAVVEQALFKRRLRRKGAVCGDLDIQGEDAGRITGQLNGCGTKNAVRVRSVSGVALSTPSLMECDTAKALNKWVKKGVVPAFKREGEVVSLRVAAHYSCRTRNNRPGAKLSEHGRARAIDISGFTLASGETVTVLNGWRDSTLQKRLKKAWKAACGPFRTVLGPEADRYHQDHFHLDTAKRRSTYCR
jgi:hypothetical protein